MDSDLNKKPSLMENTVSAGFLSASEQFAETPLDLNSLMVTNAASTFFVRVSGDSMKLAGIFDGDILVVDKSRIPTSGNIVIACVDNEFTVKYLRKENGKIFLQAANKKYDDIVLSGTMELVIFGVVTGVVRKLLK